MRQLLRFVVVGGANTLLTYGVLLALLQAVGPRTAFTVAFVTGVALSTLLTGRLVFRSRPSPSQRVAYAAWLGVVYLVGLVAVELAVRAAVPEPLLAAVPIGVSAPLNFLGGRWVLLPPSTRLLGANPR